MKNNVKRDRSWKNKLKEFWNKNKRKVVGWSLIFLGMIPLVEGGKHFIPIKATEVKETKGIVKKVSVKEIQKLRVMDRKTLKTFSQVVDPFSDKRTLQIPVYDKYWNSAEEVAQKLKSKLQDYPLISVTYRELEDKNEDKGNIIGYVKVENKYPTYYYFSETTNGYIVYIDSGSSITYTHHPLAHYDLGYTGPLCDSVIIKYYLDGHYDYNAKVVRTLKLDTGIYNGYRYVLKEFKTSDNIEETFLDLNIPIADDPDKMRWYGGLGHLGIFMISIGLYLVAPKRKEDD